MWVTRSSSLGGQQVKMAEAALRNNVLGADPPEDGPKPQLLHSPGTLANLRGKKKLKSLDEYKEDIYAHQHNAMPGAQAQ